MHLDDQLNPKQTGPFFGCWCEESELGQSLAVLWARADNTMVLSKAQQGDSSKFLVNLVPAYTQVIGSLAAELLVVREDIRKPGLKIRSPPC